MSLSTCCSDCGTRFHVVPDQLRIAHGQVRCGCCQAVFDARLGLHDGHAPVVLAPVEGGAPLGDPPYLTQRLPADAPGAAAAVTAVTSPGSVWEDEDGAAPQRPLPLPELPSLDLDAPADQRPATTPEATPAQTLPPVVAQAQVLSPVGDAAPVAEAVPPAWDTADSLGSGGPQVGQSDAVPATAAEGDSTAVLSGMLPEVTTRESAPEGPADDGADPVAGAVHIPVLSLPDVRAAPLPAFMRQARRRAWWNQPWIRFALGMFTMLLPFFLALQVALHERHRLAAAYPVTAPVLRGMCAALGCTVDAYRDIDATVITGTGFTQRDGPSGHYQLDIGVRNQSHLPVATPAMELTLSDESGQVVVRKVLAPSHMGAPPQLPPQGEWHTTLPLYTDAADLHGHISGYSVLLFYP